ncbi:hypothetical protein HYX01_01330 [Candidatus Woesearchaeota archaeon]|nr:hypothetical protein [Candidatus Woesearchaeota archaeon]
MKKIGKKAFIKKTFKFIIFVLVVILLVFLIKNKWNIPNAFSDMAEILRIK